MPTYHKGSEKNYFPMILAALIFIAIAVSTFIATMFWARGSDLSPILINSVEGVPSVDPGNSGPYPENPPNVAPPSSPPPGN